MHASRQERYRKSTYPSLPSLLPLRLRLLLALRALELEPLRLDDERRRPFFFFFDRLGERLREDDEESRLLRRRRRRLRLRDALYIESTLQVLEAILIRFDEWTDNKCGHMHKDQVEDLRDLLLELLLRRRRLSRDRRLLPRDRECDRDLERLPRDLDRERLLQDLDRDRRLVNVAVRRLFRLPH